MTFSWILFMVKALHTILHRVNMTQSMPAMAWLSCYGQQRISIDVVSKVAKPYFCPGPDNSDCSHHQAASHHHHHPKDMLNPGTHRCSCLIALLFPRGERPVFYSPCVAAVHETPVAATIL